MVSALTGTLGRSRAYRADAVPRVELEGLGGTRTLAYDGEVAPAPEGLRLEKERHALVVYRPAAERITNAGRPVTACGRWNGRRGRRPPADGGPSVPG